MQTTYFLITPYRQRITAVEQALREAGAQRHLGKQQHQRHGPVEHRKLLQRFKQFLANEEKFWTQLVVRLHHQFALAEADSALAALSIPTSDDPDGKPDTAEDSRRPFRFPAEPDEPQHPATPSQHASCLATLSKALICLGDLARYREQYSEPGNRRQDESSRRGGRRSGGRHIQGSAEVKTKTYDKARACYERARNLVPDEGNASHQLAILASYQKDTFECLVHYYRAFCVRGSYEPASENMGNVLSKFLRSWRGKRSRNATADGGFESGNRLEAFKDDVAALHALWKQGADAYDLRSPLEGRVVSEYSGLVTDRALPIDTITKIIVLAQGAYWHHKPHASRRTSESTTSTTLLQTQILTHILSLYTSLFNVSINELQDSSKIPEVELAMHITAVFRRMLPALRLAGKWLRANPLPDLLATEPSIVPSSTADAFYAILTAFGEHLASIFPPSLLPRLNRPLEEDLELAGYLPLGGLLMDIALKDAGDSRALEEVHPNEEQLMRIWDVWHDVSLLTSQSRPTPQSSSFRHSPQTRPSSQEETMADEPVLQLSPPTHDVKMWQMPERKPQDDDARTETTDPVGDAFRQVLLAASDTESEQDEIVWNPRFVYLTVHCIPHRLTCLQPYPLPNVFTSP
ncbi:hypothetical protein K488DRAFT_39863 [Vararia minispora EC-137]|uniref:Uncharacterized protein n=1 Tax=Vararia minispora EC-137 TaxID=1314806 RepID=A0ACB8QYT9_9AGAM|nr:hypothetical protein K488DRAFT_39863 [Vararia minispora EC-137]